MTWLSEHVPDDHHLYYRISKGWLKPKDPYIHPGVFRARPEDGGMSTDWAKYATAMDCRMGGSNPTNNGVVQLAVDGVRACPEMSVHHTPRPRHRSHTDIKGIPQEQTQVRNKIRLHLFNMTGRGGWVIRPDTPLDLVEANK